MKLEILVGDILDERVDVLICSANPWLALSGGVGGAILQRGGASVQAELKAHLKREGKPALPQGTVVRTGPGPLAVKHILHVVGVNAFYESSEDVVAAGLTRALEDAAGLGCRTAVACAIATGFGPLTMEQFGRGLKRAVAREYPPLEEVRIVVRKPEDADAIKAVVAAT